MVRFEENYAAHIDLGVDAYMNYDLLKKKIHEYESAPQSRDGKVTLKGGTFSALFEEELIRIDEIFCDKMRDLDYMLVDTQRLAKSIRNSNMSKGKKKAQEAALKRSATLLYQKLAKLETYRLLNRTAIIKILKKYDKVCVPLNHEPLFKVHMDMIDNYSFGHGRTLRDMISNVESLYAESFCGGVLEEAQGKLRLAKGSGRPQSRTIVAFKIGALITLIVWFANNLVLAPRYSIPYLTMEDPAVYVYAVVASLITFRWIWGFNVYMWESVHIDYILLLDLDANKHALTYDQILSEAATYSIAFFVNVMVFHSLRLYKDKTDENSMSGIMALFVQYSYMMPILLVLVTLLTILRSAMQPTSYGVFSSKVFLQLFMVPFTDVQFRHTFAADILTSFTKVMAAVVYSCCYFISGAFLQGGSRESDFGSERFAVCQESPYMHLVVVLLYLLPLYMRFMQNMRQQYDSVKRRKLGAPVAPAPRQVVVRPRATDEETADDGSEYEGGLNRRRVGSPSEDRAGQGTNGGWVMASVADTSQRSNEDMPDIRSKPGSMVAGSPAGAGMPYKLSRSESVDLPKPSILEWLNTRIRLPSWLLVWPYSFNGLKYFLSMLVVVFGAYPPQDPSSLTYKVCYLTLCAVSTSYSTYWDIFNDWQLCQMTPPNYLLRDILYYGETEYFYYIVIVLNVIFRCLWTISFTPYGSHTFFVVFEILRRSLWSCLRMELAYIQELNRRK
mmetsp:Transcript_3009/g.4581  ORF Transcript_3009/g.4581 Transcript_3009/m.4581 type:complete len:729 (-) Transcript_3009:250-2436(-)